MLKRALVFLVGVAVVLGVMVTPASATAPSDCAFSAQHLPMPNNGLGWSVSDMNAWHTPTRRAGACGKVYVESLGVYNSTSACMYAKLVTYYEDRTTRNYVGPWYRFDRTGQTINIRGSGRISNLRYYRVYAYACGSNRNGNHPPGLNVYTHAV